MDPALEVSQELPWVAATHVTQRAHQQLGLHGPGRGEEGKGGGGEERRGGGEGNDHGNDHRRSQIPICTCTC